MRRNIFAACLSALALASIASAAPIDHFKCYPARGGEPVDASVGLRDQFGKGGGQVLEPVLFCNPAAKLHRRTAAQIVDRNAHLKFYRLQTEPDDRKREVVVSNQFGEGQVLAVGRAKLLAVPTQKLSPQRHEPPRRLDHFQCYEAEGKAIRESFALRDQFGLERRLNLLSPRLLCNPVEKTHRGRVTRIQNPSSHLVCYGLEARQEARRVKTRNQFGSEGLELEPAKLMCVPSLKDKVGRDPVPGESKPETDDFTAAVAPPPFQCSLTTPDFAVTGSESTNPGDDHCFPSNGAGGFGPRSDIPRLDIVDGMDVADMDNDGDNDFLACDGLESEVYLYNQTAPSVFTPTVVASGITSGVGGSVFCTNLRVADFNGDGLADFVVGDNRVTNGTFVYLQGPVGTFTPVMPGLDVSWASPTGAPCNCLFGVAAGDVDGDGRDDVLILGYRGAGAGQVRFYQGNGAGGMAAPVVEFNVSADFPIVDAPTGIGLVDAEGDGDLDIVVGGASDGSHYLYTNDGLGNFAVPGGPLFDIDNYSGIDGYDFDSDTDDDLVLVNWSSLELLYSENIGGPTPPVPVGNLRGPSIGVGAPELEVTTTVDLDHFKCYPTETDKVVGQTVTLRDQFGGFDAEVQRAVEFCNPTEKVHRDQKTPIRDRDAHLALYDLDPKTSPAPPPQVTVSNQFFEDQRLQIGQPVALAVPSQKLEPEPHDPPQNLDHFACYEASAEPPSAEIVLIDQFGAEDGLKVLEPRLLCNPATKIHEGKETPARNEEAHLVCYALEGSGKEASAFWKNQFGEDSGPLRPADLLCVPSRKEDHDFFLDPNITQLCGDYDAFQFDGGIVPPGGPGTGLLRVNPSAAWPDGRPRRPCGEYVPIDGYMPPGGVNRFRVAYRLDTDPVPPVGTAPGIHTRWVLRDRDTFFPFCLVNNANALESMGPLEWMDASDYLDAKNGGPLTDFCPNSGLRLGVWDTNNHMGFAPPDRNGHYVVWLEWEDGGGVLHREPFDHHIQLDNMLPTLDYFRVTLADGTTPVTACSETTKNNLFKIYAEFDDAYYWSYHLRVRGGDPPITVRWPRPAEDPDGNHWHDYYDGTPQVANTDRTGTVPPPPMMDLFLRDIDMFELGASFTECCYLIEIFVRDAAIRHGFNNRVASENSGVFWDDVFDFFTFSASPP